MRFPSISAKNFGEDAQFRVAENYLLSGLGRHAPDEDVDLAVRFVVCAVGPAWDKAYLMATPHAAPMPPHSVRLPES